MTPVERMRHVLLHHQEQTLNEMAAACGCSKENIFKYCQRLGVVAITAAEQKVNIVRAAKGEKTVKELANLIGCATPTIYDICHEHNIPYKPDECTGSYVRVTRENRIKLAPIQGKCVEEDPFFDWSKNNQRREGEAYIAAKMALGYTRQQAIEILTLVVEWIEGITAPPKIVNRPPATYANLSREQMIDQILSE